MDQKNTYERDGPKRVVPALKKQQSNPLNFETWSQAILWVLIQFLILYVFPLTVRDYSVRAEQRSIDRAAANLPILSVEIKSFVVNGADMEEALRTLSDQVTFRVVIGFERIPHHEGESGQPMSLELTNTTVGKILSRLCRMDLRYEYRPVEGQMVEVFPKGALDNPEDLLNVKIKEFSVDREALPGGVIQMIGQDAPELKELLDHKKEEWMKNSDGAPGGSPGSMLSGNMPLPHFTLRLENVTVRHILNAIALESVRMFEDGKVFAPGGWEYDFVVSGNAPTTLGGYPKWKTF
jgi:hypothetical protein